MLNLDGFQITQSGSHRSLHRTGNNLTNLLAICTHRCNQRLISGNERGTIPSHIALLAQRIQHQHAFSGTRTHITSQSARRRLQRIIISTIRSTPPLHQRIAFVGKHHRADLTRSCDNASHPLGRIHLARRIARGIHPHRFDAGHIAPRRNISHIVDLKHLRSSQLRADLIRRVRNLRLHHNIILTEMQ